MRILLLFWQFISVVACNIILFTFLSISPHFLNCCIHCYTKAYGWNRLMFLFLFCSTDGLFHRSLIPDNRSCIIRRYWGPRLSYLPFSLLEVISTTVGKVLRSTNRLSMKHQHKYVCSKILNNFFVCICIYMYCLPSIEIKRSEIASSFFVSLEFYKMYTKVMERTIARYWLKRHVLQVE